MSQRAFTVVFLHLKKEIKQKPENNAKSFTLSSTVSGQCISSLRNSDAWEIKISKICWKKKINAFRSMLIEIS